MTVLLLSAIFLLCGETWASRLQTVALSMRQVSGESPLSIMIESDLCASPLGDATMRAPMHEVVLVVQSRRSAGARNSSMPALLLDSDHVSELSIMHEAQSRDAVPMRCTARLCEKRPLASRRSSVALHGRTADFVRFGCASHGRRSAHGISSGPCEGALDIGAASELWNNFRRISLAHNRLLLSVDAGPEHALRCAPQTQSQHMCEFDAEAIVRDSRTSLRTADLGTVRVDIDFSSPLHRIDRSLLESIGTAVGGTHDGSELVLCANWGDGDGNGSCQLPIAVPLHERSDVMYESSLVQLDDDDDVVTLDESVEERLRRKSSDFIPVFVPHDDEETDDRPRIVLGALMLRHYAATFALHENGQRSAAFERHEGRGNLHVFEALVFVFAVAHLAGSVCYSAELCGDAIARRIVRQTRSDEERKRGLTAFGVHLVMMFSAVVLASSCAYLLSQRVDRESLLDARLGVIVGAIGFNLEVSLWALLGFGVVIAALAPAAYALAWRGRPGSGARVRTITLLSLAYEQVSFVVLLLITAVWHEGGPFESLSSAIVALCLIGNSARHVQHALDTRIVLASSRALAFALLDVLVLGGLALQALFVCNVVILPVTNSLALTLVLVLYAIRAGAYVATVNAGAALAVRLQ